MKIQAKQGPSIETSTSSIITASSSKLGRFERRFQSLVHREDLDERSCSAYIYFSGGLYISHKFAAARLLNLYTSVSSHQCIHRIIQWIIGLQNSREIVLEDCLINLDLCGLVVWAR